jgi:methyltransferase
MTLAVAILIFVTLQRLGELVLAWHNTQRLFAQGATEVAPSHYSLMVGMHAVWLFALWAWGYDQPIDLVWLGIFVILQCLRLWVIATLGPRWTTRIIVLPNAPLVTNGPYRFLSHPNYVVVASEIAALPLALNLPVIAVIFSILNAAILWIRIRAENQALRQAITS